MGRTARPRGVRGGSIKSTWSEMQQLRQRVRDLEQMRERLSRLYFSQVETGKARMEKLHRILEVVTRLNSSLDIDTLLGQIVGAVQKSLGFRIVLLRILDPQTRAFKARAFAGLSGEAIARLEATDIPVDTFRSWIGDEFRVSRSYFISHKHTFSSRLPGGIVHDLGAREDWEWHPEDVLLVPLFTRTGDLMAYLSVDDPVDRLVPSRETIEMLEIFGNHVVVALENARLVQSLGEHGRELEAVNRRMGELNQLKSAFLSAVSHELRTPLTSIRAYLDSLREDLDQPGLEAPLRFVGILDEESRRLSDLIDSILSFSHLERGSNPLEFRSLDVGQALATATEALAPMAEAKKVSLQTGLRAADIHIEADLELLKQLILHLGGNAIKFTAPGGAVRITADADEKDLVLTFEDTGIGIPEDQLDRIFERFYQVDQSLVRRFGGTGLGLALCKSIVEVHGGSIEVRSVIGDGSTFIARLPLVAANRTAETKSAPGAVPGDSDEALRLTLECAAGVLGLERLALLVPGSDGALSVRASVGLPARETTTVAARAERIAGLGDGPQERATVTHEGRPLGFLVTAWPEGHGDAEREVLAALASRVGAVLAHVNQAQASQEALGQSAEFLRGEVTRLSLGRVGTSDRMRRARKLAATLGLAPDEAAHVAWAAVADAVDAAMTGRHAGDAETHRPLAVREILAHRHERVDGTGTPLGLVGDEIVLGARILAVAAAFEDAITDAGARPARTPAEAIEELRERAGQEFDPMVVEALVVLGVEEGWLDRGWAPGPSDAAEAA
jgi:signal transduction histidine kinase